MSEKVVTERLIHEGTLVQVGQKTVSCKSDW